MTEVLDLLAALREGSRRGAGQEVDLYRPAPSTRGIGEGSEDAGQTQVDRPPWEIAAERDNAIRARLHAGTHTASDVEWARERLRCPGLQTRVADGHLRVSCLDCQFHRPVTYGKAVVASSLCELDGVCWNAERDAIDEDRHAVIPLWQLRKPNGMPNYRNASEQERYLRESGQLAKSAGARKGPDAGTATSSGNRVRKVEWPVPWESWVEALDDPQRRPPEDADRDLLAGWQKRLIDGSDELPIEKLAAHPWRGENPQEREHNDELDIEPLEVDDIEEVAA